jgi:hypothetical protein
VVNLLQLAASQVTTTKSNTVKQMPLPQEIASATCSLQLPQLNAACSLQAYFSFSHRRYNPQLNRLVLAPQALRLRDQVVHVPLPLHAGLARRQHVTKPLVTAHPEPCPHSAPSTSASSVMTTAARRAPWAPAHTLSSRAATTKLSPSRATTQLPTPPPRSKVEVGEGCSPCRCRI